MHWTLVAGRDVEKYSHTSHILNPHALAILIMRRKLIKLSVKETHAQLTISSGWRGGWSCSTLAQVLSRTSGKLVRQRQDSI
jgi:hypothetical protein